MFNPKALLFDYDGVVIDSELARDNITRTMLAGFFISYDRDRMKPKLSGKSNNEIMRILIKEYDLAATPDELNVIRKDALEDLYKNHVDFVPRFIDLYAALRKEFDAKVAIASGCDEWLFKNSDKRLGITNMFDGNLFLSHGKDFRSKPAPDLFLYALQILNASANESVVFEDAPNGIASSIAAGIPKTVALTRTFNEGILRRESSGMLGLADEELSKKVLFIPDYSKQSIEQVLDYMKR
jgi:beta-phosphoglucomutase